MTLLVMVFGAFHGDDKTIILLKFMVLSCHTINRFFITMKQP